MRLPKPFRNVFGKANKGEGERDLNVGLIARSECGRDKGTYNIILFADEDKSFVYIGNGSGRNVRQPKKKKLKHLTLTDRRLPDEYIKDGQVDITNAKARAVIREYEDSIAQNSGEDE